MTPDLGAWPGDEQRRNALAVMLAILAAMAFLDGPILDLLADRSPLSRRFWRTVSLTGDSGWMLLGCAGAGLAAWHAAGSTRSPRYARGLRRICALALAGFACVGGTGLLAAIIKLAIGRPRPKMVEQAGLFGFDPLAFSFKMNSFPSGHATTLFALAAVVVIAAPKWHKVVLAVAGFGALARVADGAHHVSDVIAGAAFGWFGARALLRHLAVRGLPVDPDRPLTDAGTVAAAARRLATETGRAGLGALGRLRDSCNERYRAGVAATLRGGRPDEGRSR